MHIYMYCVAVCTLLVLTAEALGAIGNAEDLPLLEKYSHCSTIEVIIFCELYGLVYYFFIYYLINGLFGSAFFTNIFSCQVFTPFSVEKPMVHKRSRTRVGVGEAAEHPLACQKNFKTRLENCENLCTLK